MRRQRRAFWCGFQGLKKCLHNHDKATVMAARTYHNLDCMIEWFRGIMIRTLANASKDQRSLAPLQTVFTVCGFVITIVSTIIVTVYATKRLSELQADVEQLMLQ
ncbi:hypothetical protein HanOQP8_Chr04g0159331 [Helianthus annuus]|nr:hypothetical protein HanOQP8_Chr04g0159331 [Helianthus annuus]